MTARKLAGLIGRTGSLVNRAGLRFEVEILDGRESFGRTDVQVRPVAGSGTTWVDLDRVTLNETDA